MARIEVLTDDGFTLVGRLTDDDETIGNLAEWGDASTLLTVLRVLVARARCLDNDPDKDC